jgi:hypothetical protein
MSESSASMALEPPVSPRVFIAPGDPCSYSDKYPNTGEAWISLFPLR